MIMTRLRTCEGISTEAFGRRFGPEALQRLGERAAQFLAGGLLKESEGWWHLAPEDLLLSDFVIEALFEG